MRRVTAVVIALATPFLAWADDTKPTADVKELSGTWVTVGGEAQGMEIPKDALPFRWTFRAGGKMTFADLKQGTESTAAFRIDASRTPREIDLTYEGPAEALKGLRQYGIYAIEDGKLTLCLTQPPATEADRPKEFGTKAGRVMVWRLERAKDGE